MMLNTFLQTIVNQVVDLFFRFLPLAIALGLVILSGHFLESIQNAENVSDGHSMLKPEVYFTEFEQVQMDSKGKLKQVLSGQSFEQFAAMANKEIDHPDLTLYREGSDPWRVIADKGWVSENGNVILLQGEVEIWRQRSDGVRTLQIFTTNMRVFKEAQYAETDEKVSILTQNMVTDGVGMKAFLSKGNYEVLSNVRTRIKNSS